MANAKQVLDVQVSKGITTAQSNEHLRNRSEKASEKAAEYAMKKGNYDPTREHLNFEIVNGKVRPVDKSRSIPDRMADSLRQRGIKDPNEGLVEPKYRTVVNIILGGSRELMRQLAFGKQDVDFEQGADMWISSKERITAESSESRKLNSGQRMPIDSSVTSMANRI